MESKKADYLKIDFRTGTFNATLSFMDFMDGNFWISYCPSLRLSAYGSTQEEAQTMMRDVVLPDFFENLFVSPQRLVLNELKKFGWQQEKLFKKRFHNRAPVSRQGIIKDFNLSEETPILERHATF